MKLCSIFVDEAGQSGIWSIRFDGETESEFHRLFDSMLNTEWLYKFFTANSSDLESGYFDNVEVGEAIIKTIREVEAIDRVLHRYASGGFSEMGVSLQHLFKPLNNHEYSILPLQLSKARLYTGWVRLYAVRIAENCYVVTGGAIKLTRLMNRPHLQEELNKLKLVKRFLQSLNVMYPEDLKNYSI